ncbi:MAG: hypothetical protein ACXABY_31160 [Candidatus Thorarchaeota archaeon]|jgi:hypothetical protein
MKIESEIILARPGYNKKFKREVTWEELKRTFLLYKRIPMIIAGGSHFGPIDPNDAIGFVDAKIDEQEQVIRGDDPVFFKETFDKVPAEIQRKLINKEHIFASLGYEPFQDIRKVDHLLIGAERPLFQDIGFNAEEEEKFHYEETDGINKEEVPEEEKPTDSIAELRAEIKELKELFIESQKPKEPEPPQETPVEEVIEEKKIEEPPEEEPTDPQPKPKVEPERTIAKEVTKTSSDGLFSDTGARVIKTPLAGSKTTEEELK